MLWLRIIPALPVIDSMATAVPRPAPVVLIDTGGLSGEGDTVSVLMARQVDLAVAEADVVVFLVEASGPTTGDESIAELLRRSGKQVVLAVNKAEGLRADETAADFWSLGMGEPVVISATRGDRVSQLLATVLEKCPSAPARSRRACTSRRCAHRSGRSAQCR